MVRLLTMARERTTATSHGDTGTKTQGPLTGTKGRGHPCPRTRTGQDTRASALHSSSAATVLPSSFDGASTFYGYVLHSAHWTTICVSDVHRHPSLSAIQQTFLVLVLIVTLILFLMLISSPSSPYN